MIEIDVRKTLRSPQGEFPLAVRLELPERSVTALSGVSGSGKTSILRMIAGLLVPDEGRIAVSGEDWFDGARRFHLPPQKRGVGFVFQGDALFPAMTARGNLSYACSDAALVRELLSLTGLEGLAGRYPETLSGGQRQRLALARAVARRPRILLLDEAFSSLDPALREQMQDLVLSLAARFALTVILVSHDTAEIFRLASHQVVIDRGRVARSGPPRRLLLERATTQKFSFTGRVIELRRSDIVYTALVAIGDTVVEIVLTEDDAASLAPGDTIFAATKAFQPIVRKL